MTYNASLYSNTSLRARLAGTSNYTGISPPGNLYWEAGGLNLGMRNIPAPPTYSDTQQSNFTLTTPLDASLNSNFVNGLPVPANSARLTPGGLPHYNNAPTVLAALNHGHDGAHADGTDVPGHPRTMWNRHGPSYGLHQEYGAVGADNRFNASATKSVSCDHGMADIQGRRPLGAGLLSSGEQIHAMRSTTQERQPNIKHPEEIAVADPEFFNMSGGAPAYNSFTDDAYNTQSRTHLYKRKRMTGVLVNTNTGEMLETYEDEMPPPNTDKSMHPDQLRSTNPRLVAMQGGIDFNRPPRQKTEIQQNLPGADGGRNVWGDQLYEERRRKRLQEIAAADLWGNQGGNYSIEPIYDGRPTGFVGHQNMVRFNPYAPPTQRGRDDIAWRAPMDAESVGERTMAHTTIHKLDVTPCSRKPMAAVPSLGGLTRAQEEQLRPFLKEVLAVPRPTLNATSSVPEQYVRVYELDLPDTMRSETEGSVVPGAIFAIQNGSSGEMVFAYEHDLPDTMRAVLEGDAAHTGSVGGGWQSMARQTQDHDLPDPLRGTQTQFQWVSPTQVPNDGQTHSPFDGFTVQNVRKQAREMPAGVMPAGPVDGVGVARDVPAMTCRADDSAAAQQRIASLSTRPNYFTEASVS